MGTYRAVPYTLAGGGVNDSLNGPGFKAGIQKMSRAVHVGLHKIERMDIGVRNGNQRP